MYPRYDVDTHHLNFSLAMKSLLVANVANNGLTSIDELVHDAPNLRQLYASNNAIQHLPSMRHLECLTVLNLSHNRLASINKTIYRLSELTELNLSFNALTTLPPYIGYHLHSLVTLNLSHNSLGEIPYIGGCRALTTLYINDNKLTALPSGIGELTSLELLVASDNELVSVPDDIGRLTKLRELNLSRNRLDELPASIRDLNSLSYLELDYNSFATIPSEIYEMKKLYSLFMRKNKIRSAASPSMAKSKLGRIYLDYNYITELSRELCSIVTLKEIFIDNNLITNISPAIANLKELSILSLNWNYLTSIPAEIGENVNIGRLYLSNNQLTSIPPAIGHLVHATTLNLENNRLTSLPPTITNMYWLDNLTIDGNPIVNLDPEVDAFLRELEREEYPDGVAFEIHSAFSKIDVDEYMGAMKLIMPDVTYMYMSNEGINRYIMGVLGGCGEDERGDTEDDGDEQHSQLGMIYDRALMQIAYGASHKAMIFYALEYMKKQSVEFKKLYVSNFIYDCLNAYSGPAPMSCPKGVMERLVTSLIPSLVAHRETSRGADELLAILTCRTRGKTIRDSLSEISKECYERCGGDEATFRTLLIAGVGVGDGEEHAAEIDEFIRLLGIF